MKGDKASDPGTRAEGLDHEAFLPVAHLVPRRVPASKKISARFQPPTADISKSPSPPARSLDLDAACHLHQLLDKFGRQCQLRPGDIRGWGILAYPENLSASMAKAGEEGRLRCRC